jgi:hypothetical protein
LKEPEWKVNEMTSGPDGPQACHNCGVLLQGRFCADCGQEDRPLDPLVRVHLLILAMRAVYGGTGVRAFAHTLVVLAFHWVATIVVAAAIIAPVLFAN